MDSTNLFNGGMQSDISKQMVSKNTYLEAVNFRPLTELGESNSSLVTIKGNQCQVKFPQVRSVYKLKINLLSPSTFTDTITITVNGQTTGNIVINTSTTGLTLYNAVKALSNAYQTTNVTPTTATFMVAYEDDYIVITQQPVYTTCTPVTSVAPTIVLTQISGTNTVYYVKPDSSIQAGNTPYVDLSAGLAVIPIGSTFILDDNYVYTAIDDPAYTSLIPVNDSLTKPGQIWKLSYDEVALTSTLTLLYNSYLDFSKYHPIAPTATTARYESDGIQRLYWTDFYSKIKTINAAAPQLMALNPKLTGVVPSVGFDIPILNEIINGSLPVGTYELCYRLKQSLGAITNYSPISNMVHLIDKPINGFLAYEGTFSGVSSGHGIRWVISNIDTKFDRIEYVLLQRTNKTDVAQVYSVREDNIPQTGIVTIDVTSIPDEEIPLDEFLSINSGFTHAKTVDTKDNRLFWGNVKSKMSSVGSWDARAFRALTSNVVSTDIRLFHSGTSTNYTLANATNTTLNPETNDAINEYYTTTGAFSANACYFKPNTAGNVLGGRGTNISYEFGTYSIQLNTMNRTTNSDDSYNVYNDLPFRECDNINPSFSFAQYDLIANPDDSSNQIYPIREIGSMKNPYRTSVIKGFQHEEIYRMGIEVFDLEGRPMFTKWIGDIKMPTYGDLNNHPDIHASGAGIADFRLSYLNAGEVYGQIMYVKFDVDVTSLADIASGYRIVRMERKEDSDKTILGCGMITPTFAENASSDVFLPACWYYTDGGTYPAKTTFPTATIPVQGKAWNPYPTQTSWETLSIPNNTVTPSGGTFGANGANVKTFDCFDFIETGGVNFATGDKLFIRSRQQSENFYKSRIGGNQQGYRWWYLSGGGGADWYDLPADGGGTKYTIDRLQVGDLTPGINAWNNSVGHPASVKFQSGYDDDEMAYYLHMYLDAAVYGNIGTIAGTAALNLAINDAEWVGTNGTSSALAGGRTFHNYGRTFGTGGSDTLRPAVGYSTLALEFSTGFNDYDAAYGCSNADRGEKLLALYFKPNNAQYGGNTYSARAGNEYIACGSYIPIKRDDLTLTQNLTSTIDVFGGDVHLDYWDHQKVSKNIADGTVTSPSFMHYSYSSGIEPEFPGSAPLLGGTTTSEAHVSVTYFFPCTSNKNQEVRFGPHINTSLNVNTYIQPDDNSYASFHTNESDVVKYYSQPIDFVETDKWVNRIHYSEIKFNNETLDSWQVYKTNNFYDVEGNYGEINALVSLKENLHFIQERGFGYLYVNPITTITGDNGLPVTLGKGDIIEKHRYLALDVGTRHQWSVQKSQNALTFIDVRHKKIYTFNGESLQPISDLLGQRNFVIKRLHNTILTNDNPVIGKGIMSTYDYFNNEFLYTFKNNTTIANETNDENYTLAYSEPFGVFSGIYTFMPILYINNNRNLFSISSTDTTRCWLHNKGNYGNFYGTLYKSSLKACINDNPRYTKIFNNLSWQTESIRDNTEWRDDMLIPSITTAQTFSDDVNYLTDTWKRVRAYNEYQNTDYITLSTTPVTGNLRKVEQQWNIQNFRNKVNYDTNPINTTSIFDPTILTKTTFGDRLRDKYMIVDLEYDNALNNRFIVHNLNSKYTVSDR